MSVILKLKMMRENFSKMEQKIADYILNHPEEVKQLTTYQVAKICKTSQASIVRFAKKMGFSGYPDFKLSLSQDIGVRSAKKEVSIIDSEINSDDSLQEVCQKVAHENVKAIEDTYSLLDFKELEKAVKALAKAKKIMILGAGFSGVVAKDFSYKLLEIGKDAVFEMDFHIQLSLLSTMGAKDILFVISYSGKTKEIYEITKKAKERGILIVTLTTIAGNPIRDLGDITLNTVELNKNFRATALSPRISQMTVIDMLYVQLILENKAMEENILEAMEIVKNFKL
ncbi:MAG TPA: MurR/RpiR family transcriptional regulator [Fusobacterium sp.]|uniref:MurR/RpiR family transcriptional regulator n=1 Tax=Fusobacterium sp. TaxID=68766 RepID=UPI002F421A1A